MPDAIDRMSTAAFLARYGPQPPFPDACDEVCERYGFCLRGDCFEKPEPPHLEDAYDADEVPASRWRQAYEADANDFAAYQAWRRGDRPF